MVETHTCVTVIPCPAGGTYTCFWCYTYVIVFTVCAKSCVHTEMEENIFACMIILNSDQSHSRKRGYMWIFVSHV